MCLAKKRVLKIVATVGLLLGLTQCVTSLNTSENTEPAVSSQTSQAPAVPNIPQPTLTIQNWPSDAAPVARVYVVTMPSDYPIEVAVEDGLNTIENFAADTQALAVLNGGFFDPNNAQTTSFISVNGSLVADPRENRRLVDNPDLAPYIEKILNRSEFRRYDCGGMSNHDDSSVDGIRYDIAMHNSAVPRDCTLHSALGAGPQLLPQDTSFAEGFIDYANGVFSRDSIGSLQRNARSAVGIAENTLVWVMVAQTSPAGGMTLAELAEFMSTLQVQKALNLDGGSSSALTWSGLESNDISQTYYGRLDESGQPIQRPVKSVLVIP